MEHEAIFNRRRIARSLVTVLIITLVQTVSAPLFFPEFSTPNANSAVTSAPTISSITPHNGYAEVVFSAATNATNYDYSIDGGITWTTRSPAATWSPLAIHGLTNGQAYSIRLRGRDFSGTGAASNAVSVTPATRSQILSSQGFLQGKYVEVGVRANGAFGSSTIPSSFHGTVGSCLGFRVDRQKNGWGATVGASAPFTNIDDGDYFCPGTQYEGWALKVGSNATAFNNHTATIGIPGTISNLVTSGSDQRVDWTANSSSNGVLVKQTAIVPNDGQSLHVDVTLTNTSGSTLTNVFYLRGYDPDNSTGNSSGNGSVATSTNTVTVRGGTGVSAEVRSTFDSGAQVLLRSTDSRARAGTVNNGDCCSPATAVPDTVWSSLSPWAQAVGSPTTGDQQVAVSVKVDSLAAGATTTFRISYVLTAEDANSPTVSTEAATNVDTTTAATLNANVNPNGAASNVEFEYSTDSNLATGVTIVSAGTATGSSSTPISTQITGLTRGTTYYFRAKATNSVGTSFGTILSFTPIGPPVITISAASNLGETTTTINAQVNASGGTTSSIQFVWSTSANFTSDTRTSNSTPSSVSGNTLTSISANLTGLTPAMTYYYRVIASNAAGTTTSESISFTTTPAPSASTSSATNITSTSAVLNGVANARGNATTSLNFTYSTIPDLSSGVTTVNAKPSQAPGLLDTPESATVTGLTTGTTYYFRLNITNVNGSNSGQILSFTPSAAPLVVTETATVSGTTATLRASVNPRGATTSSLVFVYSTNASLSSDTATVSVTPNALSGATSQSVSKDVSGLTPLTTYYYRAVATNAQGSTSGSIISFTTPFADVTAPSETPTAGSSSYSKIENILITVTFSESVTGFSAADVTLGGTSAAAYGKGTPTTINPFTYTILLTPSSASPGTLTVSIPAGTVLDYSGNSNLVSPTLTLTIKNVQASFTLANASGTYLIATRMSATGGSGAGAISYAASAGTATGCSISNTDSLTSTSAGTCVVVATKAGDNDFAPISDTKTVTIAKATRTIAVSTRTGISSLTFGTSVGLQSTISAGSSDGVVSYNIGVSTGCSLSAETITAILVTGNCVVTSTISTGTNYESATSTYLIVTILKANQAQLSVGNYTAFPNISTYPLNVYGGTGLGSVTRTLNSAGNSANCSLRDGMFLTATSSGVCSVTAVKAGGSNYFDETTTATIFWVPFITNYASSSSSVPTSIPFTGQTGFERRTYETFTVISFADETGTAVTSIKANSKLRVIGTGFVAGDATTQVYFGIESVSHSGLTFNTLNPLANYVLLTVPTDAETDRVVMRSSKGWATSPETFTILP
jgi:phosphodiesterase/alkaline phosphatase D-like protein